MTQPDFDALTRPFKPDEILHFQGRGNREMSYIEDEAVMDRLDEAFGIGGWSVFVEPIPYVDGVVKVRLQTISGATYEDFGYPNRDGGESLKEAVSDGIRRAGRMLGIARDLYRRDVSRNGNGAGASSPASPPAGRGIPSPRPAASSVPVEPEGLMDAGRPQNGHSVAVAGSAQRMTVREVLAAAEAAGIEQKVVGDAAKKLYDTRMLRDLDDEQRAVVWQEIAR